MNTIRIALGALLLVLPLQAQEAAPKPDTLNRLSRSAAEQLAKSVADLDALRQQVAGEKLPLAQELTSLEEKVAQLRRDHDEAARAADSGTLELAALKTELKVRQEELDYVGNLLDDYTHSFATRVNVSELQYCGETLENAKQAGSNTALTPFTKSERRIALAKLATQRLFDSLKGLRFDGLGVDPQGSVAEGQFAIIGPVALFRAKSGAAGLVVQQTNSDKPLIRPLEGSMQAGLAALVETGAGLLPLDPSRGGALKALVQRTNLIQIFQKGGPIMWPLLVASILALGTVIERLWFLFNERRKRDSKSLDLLFAEVEAGRTENAIRISKESQYYVARTLGYALEHKQHSLANALLYATSRELKRFRRGIPILDTVITLAPLLGLLGTVTGMMGSFKLIGGDLSAPGAITGGIAEALIATAFGLGIAILSLIPFNFLNARLEEAGHEIESAAKQLELLVREQDVQDVVLVPEPRHAPQHTNEPAIAGAERS
jgi:biopolymer transport protein ExbB